MEQRAPAAPGEWGLATLATMACDAQGGLGPHKAIVDSPQPVVQEATAGEHLPTAGVVHAEAALQDVEGVLEHAKGDLDHKTVEAQPLGATAQRRDGDALCSVVGCLDRPVAAVAAVSKQILGRRGECSVWAVAEANIAQGDSSYSTHLVWSKECCPVGVERALCERRPVRFPSRVPSINVEDDTA